MATQTENRSDSFLLPCPECHQLTDSLKCYGTIVAVYFIVAASWRSKKEVACPKCMRGKVLAFAGVNLVTTHIIWPIVILPRAIIYWLDLGSPGHSNRVLEQVRSGGFGEELAAAAGRILESRPNPLTTRFLGLVKVLPMLIAMIVTASIMTHKWYELLKGDRLVIVLVPVALAFGAAAAIFWSGIGNLRLRSTSWTTWGTVAAAAAIVFVGGMPLVAKSIWQRKERADARDVIERGWLYGYSQVPAPLWQAEPLARVAAGKIRSVDRSAKPYSFEINELKEMATGIERYHAGDAAFQPTLDQLKAAITRAEQKT
jgi:hypothetical protein